MTRATTKRSRGETLPEIENVVCRVSTERTVLGSILRSSSAFRATSSMQIENFHVPSHRIIFRRMRALAATSRPLDLTTVVEELDRNGELDAVGGPAALAALTEGVPERPSIEHYVKDMRNAAALRHLYSLSESVPAALKRGDGLRDVIKHIERELAGPRAVLWSLERGAVTGRVSPDGSAVLDETLAFVRRFVGLTIEQATAVALWTVHTHGFDASETTPYLAISSAEKQCGKTRLLEVLRLLVSRPWFTGRVTAAVLVRKIEADSPTLLLDETDAAFNSDPQYAEALRGILNNGYRRGGAASVCVGKGADIEAKDFSTFCPKAFAGIGHLPETVADRSIPIRLKRKAPGEGEVERFHERVIKPQGEEIHQRIAAWVEPRLPQLSDARPDLPASLSDRQQDCVEPLVAIADAAGGDWPERARRALAALLSGSPAEDQSIRIKLLADIRDVFDQREVDRLLSRDLIEALTAIETSQWPEFNRGKPLTAVGLSRLLEPFEIAPKTIRMDSVTGKGYLRDSFEDSWRRYLQRSIDAVTTSVPCPEPSQPSQCSLDAAGNTFSMPSHRAVVTTPENENAPVLTRVVTDVTAQRPEGENLVPMLKGEL
jgi:Protein of unknown function (DUF3631)/DnaB-like helicase N terminal domain